MNNENNISNSSFENESLKKEVTKYLRYWKWILLSLILSISICVIYVKYASKVYETNAKIKILKKKDSGLDLSGLVGSSPLFDMSKINLENEIEILKSRRIIEKVIENLNLSTYYYINQDLKDKQIFGSQTPFKVNWLNSKSLNNSNQPFDTFIFEQNSNETFSIEILDKSYNKVFRYGEEINIDQYNFVIHKNPVYKGNLDETNKVFFTYKKKESLISQLQQRIKAEPVGERSEVLEIKISGQNVLKNEAILDDLIKKFNKDGINDDKDIALRTEKFINERLKVLVNELDTVETNLVDFKSENNITDLKSGAEFIFQSFSAADQTNAELQNQLEIAKYVKKDIISQAKYSLLPANVGLENDNTNALINKYNEIVQQRNKLLTSSTSESPLLINLSQQLDSLFENIKTSINNYIESLEISLKNISNREQRFTNTIGAIPENEKTIRSIQRQQIVKERLYIFLLQKKEEAALSAAITAPTAKVVDYAYSDLTPISPKTRIIYLAGLVIGLAMPIGFLYIRFLIDTKISNKTQILDQVSLPIVAEIPLNKKYKEKIITPTDKSDLAEAFRILRTNIKYLLQGQKTKNKTPVIFTTSSTKGEGKTFTAINTASILASNNNKILLIGCDLRNPQLHTYLNVSKNVTGLSAFLVNSEVNYQDIILNLDNQLNFDIILSGEIPPNPSELLSNGRFETLIKSIESQYDYIIVDTAPTLLVTDTQTISDIADVIIYLVRTDFTELKILNHIKELQSMKKMSNLSLVINGIRDDRSYDYNYGYGYGYSEHTKKKKWYQF